MKKNLLLALAFTCMTQLFATDYYVDADTGSDSNDGKSAATAWKSFSTSTTNGAFRFNGGDKLYIKAGTSYQNQQLAIIECAATEENPFIVTSYGEGDKPLINLGTSSSYTDKRAALYIKNSSGIEVSNLDLQNYKGTIYTTTTEQRYGAYIYASNLGEVKHIKLTYLDVQNVKGNISSGDDTAGTGIFYYCEGTPSTYYNGLEIGYCNFNNVDRLAITGNNAGGRAIGWYNNINVHIHRNTLTDIGGQGITIKACDGAICEYNRVDGCGVRDRGVGIWSYKADNTVFQYNIVSNAQGASDAQGFDSDYNCTNTLFQYNMSVSNEGGFMLICTNGSGNPEEDGTVTWNSGLKGTTIRYNLSVNDGFRARSGTAKAYFSPTFHITGAVKESHIYGNTLIMSEKPESTMDCNFTTFMAWSNGTPNGVNFYNNIFYAGENVEGAFDQHDQGGSLSSSTGVEFSNNIYVGNFANTPTSTDDMFPSGGAITNTAKLMYDEAGIKLSLDDPLFMDASGIADFDITDLSYEDARAKAEVFNLVEGSAALGAGKTGFFETLADDIQAIQYDYYALTDFTYDNGYTPYAKDYVMNNFGDMDGKFYDFFGNDVDDSGDLSIGFSQLAGDESGIMMHTTYEQILVYPTYTSTTVTIPDFSGYAYLISPRGALLGKYASNGSAQTIDVSTLSSGIYFIRTAAGTGKFIKE